MPAAPLRQQFVSAPQNLEFPDAPAAARQNGLAAGRLDHAMKLAGRLGRVALHHVGPHLDHLPHQGDHLLRIPHRSVAFRGGARA